MHVSKVSTLLFGERMTWIANLMSSQTLESSNTEARPNLITGKKISDRNKPLRGFHNNGEGHFLGSLLVESIL